MVERHRPYGFYERFVKRLLDVFCAILVIVVFWWLYLLIAILVKMKLGSPVLFQQSRPGKNERVFKLYKFRSMSDEKDKDGMLLPDEVRLGKFGSLLRKTSLDELPEIFNILKGDMSVVGPRPLVPEYIPYYTEEEKHRHDIRPGLTGLAQVNGRSFISWEQIFEYDVNYTRNITFLGDLKIIFKTLRKVISHENVADVTESVVDEKGQLHFMVDGVDYILHQPLNVERGC